MSGSRSVESPSGECKRTAARCSIIIPVFNRVELTRACLKALFRTTSEHDTEIIVVDNGSSDGTANYLTSLSNSVRVIHTEQNLGFACACNHGAHAATTEHLLFLNNDTIPLPDWLGPLLTELQQHSEVAIVGSKLLYPNGTIQHAGVAFSIPDAVPYHIFRGMPCDHPAVDGRREVRAVTGACMLVRRSLFESLGGFDEAYRNGFEDVDLCLRAGDSGSTVVYQPRSVVIHLEEQSDGRKDHDQENLERFLFSWTGRSFPDEVGRLLESRLTSSCPRVEPCPDDLERVRWELVAEMERRLAASGLQTVNERPPAAEEWPCDFAALRWGESLCIRSELLEQALNFRRRLEKIDPNGSTQPAGIPRVRVSLHAPSASKDPRRPRTLRVVVLSLERRSHACAVIRVLAPAAASRPPLDVSWVTTLEQAGSVDDRVFQGADLVVVQRFFPHAETSALLNLLLGSPVPVIYDLDDLLTEIPRTSPCRKLGRYCGPHILDTIRRADMVTVSTENLAQYYADLNPRIRVLPNLVDPRLFLPVRRSPRPFVRILYSGTPTHEQDLRGIEVALLELKQRFGERLRFCFMGCVTRELAAMPKTELVEMQADYSTYGTMLSHCDADLAIVPLGNHRFNRCKSNIKWLEYSACKIPAVYSDIPPYRDCIEGDGTGLLVSEDPAAWVEAISCLVEKPDLRRELAERAHREVLAHYSLASEAVRFREAYSEVISLVCARSDSPGTAELASSSV